MIPGECVEIRGARVSVQEVEKRLSSPILIAYDNSNKKRFSYTPATGEFEVVLGGIVGRFRAMEEALQAYNDSAI